MAMGDDGARILHAEASRRRDYGDGRRREGLAVPAGPRFRPCLWRFFAKGTVGCARYSAISTVPLMIFCKRHGRLHRLCHDFDRAFDDFLQKARSVMPTVHAFRPCLCRFFAKGTVGCTHYPAVSTVPLAFFCKRHGRAYPLSMRPFPLPLLQYRFPRLH